MLILLETSISHHHFGADDSNDAATSYPSTSRHRPEEPNLVYQLGKLRQGGVGETEAFLKTHQQSQE